jgi:MSHA biogenesis protein MshP
MFPKKTQKGFVLAYALILLVIFSLLGVSIVSMLTTSSVTSSEDFISLQALYIAESGAEIRIRETLEGDTTEDSRTYEFDNFNNYSTNVTLKKIMDGPDGKKLFSVYSTGKIFNIKRKIFIKFWKQ